jgi:nicotinamidase-related amidase
VGVNDTVLTKYRYFAGAGNALELILNTDGITTVVISGVRTSGVVLATAMWLFDGDYDVIVVRDCTLETPVGAQADMIQESLLGTGGVIEKMGAQVVMLADVLAALEGWGG